jgi:hypothetical protein
MALVDISRIVLILTALSFSFFVIVILNIIGQHVEAVRKDFNKLVENSIPVMSNLKAISDNVKSIIVDIEGYCKGIDGSIKKLRKQISKNTFFKQYYSAKYCVNHFHNNIRALVKASSVFRDVYK